MRILLLTLALMLGSLDALAVDACLLLTEDGETHCHQLQALDTTDCQDGGTIDGSRIVKGNRVTMRSPMRTGKLVCPGMHSFARTGNRSMIGSGGCICNVDLRGMGAERFCYPEKTDWAWCESFCQTEWGKKLVSVDLSNGCHR